MGDAGSEGVRSAQWHGIKKRFHWHWLAREDGKKNTLVFWDDLEVSLGVAELCLHLIT